MVRSGIYWITENIKGRVYVGSSIDVFNRWRRHRWELRKGIHYNIFLQNAWNKQGESTFQFTFVEPVEDKYKLIEREQWWLDITKTYPSLKTSYFNAVFETGGANLFDRKQGTKSETVRMATSHRMKGNTYAAGKSHSHTKEVRKQISEKLKGTKHSEESYKQQAAKITGRKHTDEAISKMIKYQRLVKSNKVIKIGKIHIGKANGTNVCTCKLDENKVIQIRKMYNEGCSGTLISSKFSVHSSTIYNIVKYKTWKQVL